MTNDRHKASSRGSDRPRPMDEEPSRSPEAQAGRGTEAAPEGVAQKPDSLRPRPPQPTRRILTRRFYGEVEHFDPEQPEPGVRLPEPFRKATAIWEAREPDHQRRICALLKPYLYVNFIPGNCRRSDELFVAFDADHNPKEYVATRTVLLDASFERGSPLPSASAGAWFDVEVRARMFEADWDVLEEEVDEVFATDMNYAWRIPVPGRGDELYFDESSWWATLVPDDAPPGK